MDLRKIKKLIELVEESGIAELEVRSGDEAVRIARPSTAQPVPRASTGSSAPQAAPTPEAKTIAVRAPMAGTFYVAGEPGGTPFAPVGAAVAAESVVCIIESMKMMNEIRAPTEGQCVEVLVRDGEPVSAGQLLLRLAPAAA